MYGQVWFEQNYFEVAYYSDYFKHNGSCYNKLAVALALECSMNSRANRRISKHATKWFAESFNGKCLATDLADLVGANKAEITKSKLLQASGI